MLARLATLGLTPILLAQALYVRGTTERLPEPPGPRAGRLGKGPRLRLLICGDSAAAGVGVEHQREALSGQLAQRLKQDFQLSWCLAATTGHNTRDAIARLQEARPRPLDVALCSLGVNDVTTGVRPEQWRTQLDTLHTLLRERFGVRQVLFAAVPPMQHFPALPRPLRNVMGRIAGQLDRALEDWTLAAPGRQRLPLDGGLDPAHMARDGFHPGAPIYARVAEAAAAAIRGQWLAPAGP